MNNDSYQELIEFESKFVIDDKKYNKSREQEKIFYELYPFEKFKILELNEYVNDRVGDNFMGYFEKKSNFVASGFLANNKNRIFYFQKKTQSIEVNDSFRVNFTNGESIEQMFYVFRDLLVKLCLTKKEDYNPNDFQLINNYKVIKTKIYNLYSEEKTLFINNITRCREVYDYLGIDENLDSLQTNFKAQEILNKIIETKELYYLSELVWVFNEKLKLDKFTEFYDFAKTVTPLSQNPATINELEEFYSKFPFEKFKNLTLQEWDAEPNSDTFTHYLMSKTENYGSGNLGLPLNKLYFFDKEEQKYTTTKSNLNFYKEGTSIEFMFKEFMKQLIYICETKREEIDFDKLDLLNGANVLSNKIFNFYNKDKTLTMNAPGKYEKALEYFGVTCDDKNIIQTNFKLEKIIRDSNPYFKDMDSIEIGHILYKFALKLNENIDPMNMERDPMKSAHEYKQIIYAGPPGTSKSYSINNMLEERNVNLDNNVTRLTFYQDYENYNFIGQIEPVIINEDMKYMFVPGPFTSILKKAILNPSEHFYLIIEEMTRGNITAILGDVFQLLDREKNKEDINYGNSLYPINNQKMQDFINDNELNIKVNNIIIPNNLSIYGTINTSDQGVNIIDTATQRRFDFKFFDVQKHQDKIKEDIEFKIGGYELNWKESYMYFNDFIIEEMNMSEDKQMGPFFITSSDEITKLVMYLWDSIDNGFSNHHSGIFNKEKSKSKGKILRDIESENVFSEEFKEYLDGKLNR